MILQSHSSCDTRASGAPVHLRACLKTRLTITLMKWPCKLSNEVSVQYLSFCKHTDVGSGIGGIIIFAIGEDGAVKESQVITGWVVQLHLRVNKGKYSENKNKTYAITYS